MSNWDTQKVKTLKKQWATITSGRNASDHGLATWAQRATKVLPDGEFQDFCTSPKGLELHSNTSRGYERMAKALDKVSDSAVWKAVGWGGVRVLVRVEKQKEITAICRWVIVQAKRAPVTLTALTARIETKAKSYKAPAGGGNGGGGGGGGGGGTGKTKSALKREVEKISHKHTTLKSRHSELVADITKVIAKWPIIKNDLSPATIATLGLKGGQVAVTSGK